MSELSKYTAVRHNMKTGGKIEYLGYRPIDCTQGADNSAHRRGQALDLICAGDIDAMRLKIIEKNVLFQYLTVMEAKVPWLHISCENMIGNKSIVLVEP